MVWITPSSTFLVDVALPTRLLAENILPKEFAAAIHAHQHILRIESVPVQPGRKPRVGFTHPTKAPLARLATIEGESIPDSSDV